MACSRCHLNKLVFPAGRRLGQAAPPEPGPHNSEPQPLNPGLQSPPLSVHQVCVVIPGPLLLPWEVDSRPPPSQDHSPALPAWEPAMQDTPVSTPWGAGLGQASQPPFTPNPYLLLQEVPSPGGPPSLSSSRRQVSLELSRESMGVHRAPCRGLGRGCGPTVLGSGTCMALNLGRGWGAGASPWRLLPACAPARCGEPARGPHRSTLSAFCALPRPPVPCCQEAAEPGEQAPSQQALQVGFLLGGPPASPGTGPTVSPAEGSEGAGKAGESRGGDLLSLPQHKPLSKARRPFFGLKC